MSRDLIGMSHPPGLFDGPFGPQTQVLLLALNPKCADNPPGP